MVKMATEHNSEVLYSVLKHKKAAMCLTEKIHVAVKFRLGTSYSAVACEFDVTESQCILNKLSLNRNSHKTKLCIGWLM